MNEQTQIHMTMTEPGPENHTWMWYCRCEAYQIGFKSVKDARKAGDAHLDETNGAT